MKTFENLQTLIGSRRTRENSSWFVISKTSCNQRKSISIISNWNIDFTIIIMNTAWTMSCLCSSSITTQTFIILKITKQPRGDEEHSSMESGERRKRDEVKHLTLDLALLIPFFFPSSLWFYHHETRDSIKKLTTKFSNNKLRGKITGFA